MPSLNFTQEAQFAQAIETDISAFWSNREEKIVTGKNDVPLYTVSLTSANHNKLIVMVNGRTEASIKYQEVFYDLFRQGYDIYAFDHRGQGMSGRIAFDKHMGHVEDFQDYIEDMDTVLQHFPLSRYSHKYLLGHSMGGAITTRYLQTFPDSGFDAAVLSSPMLGIYMHPLLQHVASPISKMMTSFSSKPTYSPGQSGYSVEAFEENALTHSQTRYSWSMGLNEQIEQIRMGGPTNQWVAQALHASKLCIQHATDIKIPLLLMQAENDTVVSNQAQNQFMQNLAKTDLTTKKVMLLDSYHEPLLESDIIRNQALSEILNWYRKHQS
jgi:lysophospholipase